jgi:hypothetical protein
MIEQIMLSHTARRTIQIQNEFIDGFQSIISENNHAALFNKICSITPEIVNFEKAGLLLKDPV